MAHRPNPRRRAGRGTRRRRGRHRQGGPRRRAHGADGGRRGPRGRAGTRRLVDAAAQAQPGGGRGGDRVRGARAGARLDAARLDGPGARTRGGRVARRVEALRRAPGDGGLGGRVDPRLPRASRGRRRADAGEPRPDGRPPARRARRRRAHARRRPGARGRAGDRRRRGGVGRETVVRRGAPRSSRGGGAPRCGPRSRVSWTRPAIWGAPTRSSIACSMAGGRDRAHRDPGGRRSSRRRRARGCSRARAVELAREHARDVGPADGRAHPASARDPLRPPRPRSVSGPAGARTTSRISARTCSRSSTSWTSIVRTSAVCRSAG